MDVHRNKIDKFGNPWGVDSPTILVNIPTGQVAQINESGADEREKPHKWNNNTRFLQPLNV